LPFRQVGLNLNPLTSNPSVAFDRDRWLSGVPMQCSQGCLAPRREAPRGAWHLGKTPSADGGRGFLIALTLVPALTGLTADIVDEIEAPPGCLAPRREAPRGAWHLGETPSADGGRGFFDCIDLSASIDGIDRGHC